MKPVTVSLASRNRLAKKIAANVVRLCKDKGMTLANLAKAIGIPPRTLSRLLAWHRGPSVDLLFALADAFEIPTDELRAPIKKTKRTTADKSRRPQDSPARRAGSSSGRSVKKSVKKKPAK